MSQQNIKSALAEIESVLTKITPSQNVKTVLAEIEGVLTRSILQQHVKQILAEIDGVLTRVDQEQVDAFIDAVVAAKKVVCVGAGRVGMAVRGFAMRLGHFGVEAYMLGDTTVPHIGTGDLLIAASGSGETQTVFDIVEIAKRNTAKVALVTGSPASRMGKLADVLVEVKAPSKTRAVEGFMSVQPMTTLNEQCLGIFFDAVVLQMMHKLGETHETMWARHSNLE